MVRSLVHRWSAARQLPGRLASIEQNLRELNVVVERLERQVTTMVEVEVPGLFLAAERSVAEARTATLASDLNGGSAQ